MPKQKLRKRRKTVRSPVKRKRGLIALLKAMKPVDEAFPEIDDPAPR